MVPHVDPMGRLLLENQRLRKELQRHNQTWYERIDDYVDQWFERNRDQVELGRVEVMGHELDLFPNWLEKKIYKKLLSIALSFLREHTVDVV